MEQEPHSQDRKSAPHPYPHVLHLPLVYKKALVKEYIESKKWEYAEVKENGKIRQNNSSLATKQSQGPLIPSQIQQIIFWSISFDLIHIHIFAETENPTRQKKLSTWWPDGNHDISCSISCSSKNWLQWNGNKLTLALKSNYT